MYKIAQNYFWKMMASILSKPKLIYGTAWKKDDTAAFVEQAIVCGFRAIDTACQPKHYNERGVGDAIDSVMKKYGLHREELFIQTKFTPVSGQDHNMPYNQTAPVYMQVQESIARSLQNLRTTYVDSLVLHSPYPDYADTLTAWRSMEEVHIQGKARQLGISNTYDLTTLKKLYADASVKPRVVQNRFYAESNYDTELRAWCQERDIRYQSFWTLTANPHLLQHPILTKAAETLKKTTPQILFRYLIQRNVDPLTGTKSATHMKEDLEVLNFSLDERTVSAINALLSESSPS